MKCLHLLKVSKDRKLITPNANISLLSIKVSVQIFDNINCIYYIQHNEMYSYSDNQSDLWVTLL